MLTMFPRERLGRRLVFLKIAYEPLFVLLTCTMLLSKSRGLSLHSLPQVQKMSAVRFLFTLPGQNRLFGLHLHHGYLLHMLFVDPRVNYN